MSTQNDEQEGAESTVASSKGADLAALLGDIKLAHLRRRKFLFADSLESQADFENLYSSAGEGAVLWAVAEAAATDRPIPEWAASAFLEKFSRVMQKEAQSWDEVFGKPHPPRTNFKAIHKWRKLADPVFEEIQKLRSENVPIDEAFAIAGDKYLISASTARDYYYRYVKQLVKVITK